jgi:hypothetical protein
MHILVTGRVGIEKIKSLRCPGKENCVKYILLPKVKSDLLLALFLVRLYTFLDLKDGNQNIKKLGYWQ